MNSSQVPRMAAVLAVAAMVWTAVSLPGAVSADAKTEKSILQALTDADRYAGGAGSGSGSGPRVANAWERASDGWVRGGYTLLAGEAGDVRTDVRYTVDPRGEMRVTARRPATSKAGMASAPTTTVFRQHVDLAAGASPSPLLYQRLVHFGEFYDDSFDDDDHDHDDEHDFDDPFFFDEDQDNWNAPPVEEWARLIQPAVVVGVSGANGLSGVTGCQSTKCVADRGVTASQGVGVGVAPPIATRAKQSSAQAGGAVGRPRPMPRQRPSDGRPGAPGRPVRTGMGAGARGMGPQQGASPRMGPGMGPRSRQGPNMDPRSRQGPGMDPRSRQGPGMDPRSGQRPGMDPRSRQGMVPRSRQGPSMDPRSRQGMGRGAQEPVAAASFQTDSFDLTLKAVEQ